MTAVFGAAAGWLLFAALVGAIGAVVGRWILVPRCSVERGPSREWMLDGTARLGSWAALVMVLALGLFFIRQLQEFRDPFAPLRDDALLLLTATPWGQSWTWAVIGSLVAVVALFVTRSGSRAGWWIATPVVLALGAFPAFTGHAAGEDRLRAIALTADTLHVWAASGWIGGLALVLLLEARWRRSSPGSPASLLPALVPAFSPLAIACVTVLVVTGLFASWMHLPGIDALVTTGYGRLLLMKLALVGVVLGLGALNWRRLTPRLGEPGGHEALRRAATTELLVAQVVLFVTAILVRTSPMDH